MELLASKVQKRKLRQLTQCNSLDYSITKKDAEIIIERVALAQKLVMPIFEQTKQIMMQYYGFETLLGPYVPRKKVGKKNKNSQINNSLS